jgi:tRNA nucleotidyltransferase/poly(A) polymerase
MTAHVMDADNAHPILSAFQRAGIEATVGGGWAIDALLGEQTRLHSDLDLWVAAETLSRSEPAKPPAYSIGTTGRAFESSWCRYSLIP